MKGVLLAAGCGTRIRPLTYVINKTALPVYDRPMFYFGLKTLLNSDVNDICIVVGKCFEKQIKTLVKYFPDRNKLKIKYIYQTRRNGMAHAIYQSKRLIGYNNFVVIPGDNIFSDCYRQDFKRFTHGAVAYLRKVPDPERFGTIVLDDSGNVKRIIEKPKLAQTKYAVTSPYIFDKHFFYYFNKIKPSNRGEYEITDILNLYLESATLKLFKRRQKLFDTGTFDSICAATQYIKRNITLFNAN